MPPRALCLLLACLAVAAGTAPTPVAAQEGVFLGEIRWVGFNFAPRGWAFCDGQLLAIAQNTALFSLLGTTYGGNGQTTFALPDLRGRAPLHQGQGPGLSDRTIGEMGGDESVTLLQSEMPAHSHALMASTMLADETLPRDNVLARPSIPKADGTPRFTDTEIYRAGPPNAAMSAASIGSAGGNSPHPNMPPYTALTCIIALQGIFPSRD